MVHAAVNGISAIILPAGKVLAKCDHYKEGPGMICAEVGIHQNKTTFSQLGHSPVILSALYLAFYIGRRRQFTALREMPKSTPLEQLIVYIQRELSYNNAGDMIFCTLRERYR